jgi:hypothetical protein
LASIEHFDADGRVETLVDDLAIIEQVWKPYDDSQQEQD